MSIKYISLLIAMNIRRFAIALSLVAATACAAIAISSTWSTPQTNQPTEIAVFSGGCFWGLQAAFDAVDGVVSSRVGYTGGDVPNPTYSKVVFGKTGHAEAVEVTYDPSVVSFDELLQIHIARVKPKVGEPSIDYPSHHSRAAVFVRSDEQRQISLRAVAADQPTSKHILIETASIFWEAEAEHQNYLADCLY